MAKKESKGGKKVREYLAKFPKSSKKSIARKLHQDHPLLFASVERARSAVRLQTGANGVEKRKNKKNIVEHKTNFSKENPYGLPDSDETVYEPYILPKVNNNIGLLYDIHVPYHSIKALTCAINYLKEQKINTLILGGDVMDCYKASRFSQDPTKRNLKGEIELTRELLVTLQKTFPTAKLFYLVGNHCARWELLLRNKAPEICDMDEFRLDVVLGLRPLGIEYITNKRIIKAGKLNIIHGHEFMGGGGGGVNPARALYLKAKKSTIEGHFHQVSEHTEPSPMDGELTTCWSVGCLCYSADTEILTQDGYKLFKDVKKDDLIGVYDMKKNIMKLSKPLKRQVFKYTGKMVNIKGYRIDALVTPEHKMLSCKHKLMGRPAEEFMSTNGKHNFRTSARFSSQNNVDLNMALLCAWIVTEGTYDNHNLMIYQKKKKQCKKIESLLNTINIKYGVYVDKRNGVKRYKISSSDSRKIIYSIWGESGYVKRIPRQILNSDYSILNPVFQTLVEADGHRRAEGSAFVATIDKGLAEDYAEIISKIGHTSKTLHKYTDTNYKKNASIYRVAECKANNTSSTKVTTVDYDDFVYDFTSETGWLVVRRNGQQFIASNCELNPEYMPLNKWSHGFAHVKVLDDGNFQVRNIRIKDGKIL